VAIGRLADGGGAYGRELSKDRGYETVEIGLGATEKDR
jgi:hypothetical protein